MHCCNLAYTFHILPDLQFATGDLHAFTSNSPGSNPVLSYTGEYNSLVMNRPQQQQYGRCTWPYHATKELGCLHNLIHEEVKNTENYSKALNGHF